MKIRHLNRLLWLVILGLVITLTVNFFYFTHESVVATKNENLNSQKPDNFLWYCKMMQKKQRLFVVEQEVNNPALDNLVFELDQEDLQRFFSKLADDHLELKQFQMISDEDRNILLLILQKNNSFALADQTVKNNFFASKKIKWLGYITGSDNNLALLQFNKQKIETVHVWQWVNNENIFVVYFDKDKLVYWQAGELHKLLF